MYARQTRAWYASSVWPSASMASVSRGTSSLRPWMEAGVEEADSGRWEADAICASDRAVSVRPKEAVAQRVFSRPSELAKIHFLVGACLSTLRASSWISCHCPLQSALSRRPR